MPASQPEESTKGSGQPATASDVRTDRMKLNLSGKTIVWGSRTLIMGIVNVTPDSFSGDGEMNCDAAVQRGLGHLKNGADIIDIGGESTRPGYRPIDANTEIQRVEPVLKQFRVHSDAIISIDTYKPAVLRAAVKAGASMLNSVWGIEQDLMETALLLEIPIVIMHNQQAPRYDGNVVDQVLRYLELNASRAVSAGMKIEQVILDPGIGFGKLPEHNIALLKSLNRLVALGFPTLIGTSRKSTIGKITGRPVNDRVFGTAATVALAVAAGIDVVRVHDVREIRDVIQVSDAIVRDWRPPDWEAAQ